MCRNSYYKPNPSNRYIADLGWTGLLALCYLIFLLAIALHFHVAFCTLECFLIFQNDYLEAKKEVLNVNLHSKICNNPSYFTIVWRKTYLPSQNKNNRFSSFLLFLFCLIWSFSSFICFKVNPVLCMYKTMSDVQIALDYLWIWSTLSSMFILVCLALKKTLMNVNEKHTR